MNTKPNFFFYENRLRCSRSFRNDLNGYVNCVLKIVFTQMFRITRHSNCLCISTYTHVTSSNLKFSKAKTDKRNQFNNARRSLSVQCVHSRMHEHDVLHVCVPAHCAMIEIYFFFCFFFYFNFTHSHAFIGATLSSSGFFFECCFSVQRIWWLAAVGSKQPKAKKKNSAKKPD